MKEKVIQKGALTLVKEVQNYKIPQESVEYLVTSGDTLENLAWKFYKNKDMKKLILNSNNINENEFKIGLSLNIPIIKSINLTNVSENGSTPAKKEAQLFGLMENYTALGDETMEYLSHIYYREAKFAYIIATYNNKPINYKLKKGEKVTIPYKIVEVRGNETIFQIAERETLQRNYFIQLLMINKKIKVKAGDRLKVPPVMSR